MTGTISTTGKRVRAPSWKMLETRSEESEIYLRLEELEAENLVRNPTPILDQLALRL